MWSLWLLPEAAAVLTCLLWAEADCGVTIDICCVLLVGVTQNSIGLLPSGPPSSSAVCRWWGSGLMRPAASWQVPPREASASTMAPTECATSRRWLPTMMSWWAPQHLHVSSAPACRQGMLAASASEHSSAWPDCPTVTGCCQGSSTWFML